MHWRSPSEHPSACLQAVMGAHGMYALCTSKAFSGWLALPAAGYNYSID